MMRLWQALIILGLIISVHTKQSTNLTVFLEKVVGISSEYLVSYTIDTGAFYDTPGMNFTAPTLQYMAKQLNPVILRVGGSTADKTYYFTNTQTGNCTEKLPKDYNCFTKQNLEDLINFVENVGCKMIFGLSIGYPTYPNPNTTSWNSSNTQQFLQYIVGNDYTKYFYGFTLGNEIETHAKTPVSFQVNAFKQLQQILSNIFPSSFQPILAGPDSDCNTLRASESRFKYIQDFIAETCDFIDVYAYHSYINVNASYLVTVDGINEQHKESKRFQKAVVEYCNGSQLVYADEIAEHSHGGVDGFNNKYEDTLWYLNAFGTLAMLNQSGLMRQKLSSYKQPPDSYVLLTEIDGVQYMPLPDYWIAVMFNMLINSGKGVMNASNSIDEYLKTYGFCGIDNDGSVVVIYVNIMNESVDVYYDDGGLGGSHMDYMITSKDYALNTNEIYLNGKELVLNNNHTLPELKGNLSNDNPIQIEPYSVGFVHFIGAKSQVCL